MLKALLLFLMNLDLAGMATAQTNLVLNGSFEDTVDCAVLMPSTLLKAANWHNPTGATPDLFDCDLDRICGFAMNLPYWNGFMFAQEGTRHAGAYFWDGPSPNSYVRDFLMAELSEPMAAGTSYAVSLWYASRRPHQYGVDHIGVWFGPDAIHEDTIGPMSLIPQVRLTDPNHTYMGESEVWTQLMDTVVAQGGERWLVIGNFDPVGQVDGSLVNPDGLYGTCYYYIDGVVVRPLGLTSVSEHSVPRVWWNGNAWQLNGLACKGSLDLEVYDMLGAVVHRDRVFAEDAPVTLDYVPLSTGCYVMGITCGNSRSIVRFIK